MYFLFPEDAKSTYVAHSLREFQMSPPPALLKTVTRGQSAFLQTSPTNPRTASSRLSGLETSFAFAQPAARSPVCRPSSPSSPRVLGPKTVATTNKRKETASGARRSDQELAATCGALTRDKSQTSQPDSNRPTSTEGGAVHFSDLSFRYRN